TRALSRTVSGGRLGAVAAGGAEEAPAEVAAAVTAGGVATGALTGAGEATGETLCAAGAGGRFPSGAAVAASGEGGNAGATGFFDLNANHNPAAMAMTANPAQTLFMT